MSTMKSETTAHCFTLFILTLSLITVAVFLSELLYPYTFLPSSYDAFVEIMEWQTRLNSSALAFGAIIYVLYQLFMMAAELLISFGLCVWRRYVAVPAVQDLQECSESSVSPTSVYVSLLVTAIIVNDSVFNREIGTPIISGSIDRLITMILRAFPVCTVELVLLFLIFFVVGCWTNRYSEGTSTGQELPDLERGITWPADVKPLQQPTTTTPYRAALIDEKVYLEMDSHLLLVGSDRSSA